MQDFRAADIHPVAGGEPEDVACQLRAQLFGAITEISLGSTHVCGIGHRVFPASGKTEFRIGEFTTLLGVQSVVHNFKID